jgi:alpha-glucosidase
VVIPPASEGLPVAVDQAGRVAVGDPEGGRTESMSAVLTQRDGLSLDWTLGPEESVYGLGEKTGFLDKRGRCWTMWNTDDPDHLPDRDPLYQSIPFLIRFDGHRAWGMFVDSTGRSSFDVGCSDRQVLGLRVHESHLDLYLIQGGEGGPAAVVAAWARLSGTMKLPPRWALGFQQCRWSYYPEQKVLEVAEEFRARHLPCDVLYLDIDYMDGYRVFTWNRERFPRPEVMSARLRDLGFRLVTIVDPGVKQDAQYSVYVDGARDGLFCRLPDGQIYHGKVWPGDSAYPDFSQTKTRVWWGHLHAALFDAGVSGIWNDMNEPSDFAPDAQGDRTKATVPALVMQNEDGNPRSIAEGHNVYGFDMCRATHEGFARLRPNQRPFVLTRAGYAGIQRYAAVWTGDNHSWWEHLASAVPMLLNLGLSGVPFCGGDAGGFQGEADGELYARWVQFAAFTPFFRAHSTLNTRPHEPWAFGPEVEAIAREALRRRYALLPYLYSLMRQASVTGEPVMRALVLDWPEDPRVRHLDDQFLFGPSILVAPVQRPGQTERLVYLPQGRWYDWYTKEPLEGGRSHIVAAPLDRIPLFVKAGALVPLATPADHTGAMDWSQLQIEAYAGADGSFDLYEDDGETPAYEGGAYDLTRFVLKNGQPASVTSEVLHRGWGRGCAQPKIVVIGPR